MWANGSLIGGNSKHFGESPGCFHLADPVQVGGETDQIAAAVTGGKVGPTAGGDIDFETAAVAIFTRGVQCHPLATFQPAIRQPPLNDGGGLTGGSVRDASEGDAPRPVHSALVDLSSIINFTLHQF
jgi:hypothetical protein